MLGCSFSFVVLEKLYQLAGQNILADPSEFD
jgi:hypothetical protein